MFGFRAKRDLGSRVCELVLTLALCHNVTPTYDDDDGNGDGISAFGEVTYQAASLMKLPLLNFVNWLD